MISNPQFYGVTILIGFIVSLAFRKEEQAPNWMKWVLISAPLTWTLLGIIMIVSVGDKSIDGIQDILTYFDAGRFFEANGYRKAFFVIAILFTTYFSLLFSFCWAVKNKAYQVGAHNVRKRTP
ncbi:hypothetical protein IEN85_12340 [Pelagicoccus sp. NFK12]|uniref:Uncharacterized protein n=2 Tax=Pelagicoccus enzymogenes TaxID=2773457 RepID=A0A927F760_9BACT|nr:hypothetical protein [Pelagicoccus enzymogenes]MBD5779482.1 hypothetical protein [Pelagicoccus enzymogenes]MBD5779650.1 hypothetical protein [Pelagicoccus enzymogenes]MBD5779654.1 hypothetical protein [Pelagicoccus enzymogenes]MBD5779964.1 hypothetical protein [Pelagicoccus enzymogenes]MBD5779992.1 hypothetical protein [Pelagicoccus enzymogenes]